MLLEQLTYIGILFGPSLLVTGLIISRVKNIKKVRAFAIISIIYFLILFVLVPYVRYPYYVIKCRQLPVIAWDFAGGMSYKKPGDFEYWPDLFTSRYFCSEKEAINEGFIGN